VVRIAFIDFEASGLGPLGFPIEVAWGFPDTGEVEEHLIRPAPDWDTEFTWDPEAAAIHKIDRHVLTIAGEPHDWVARRLVEALDGCRIFSDAPRFDWHWLALLVFDSGLKRAPVLEHFEGLLLEISEKNFDFSTPECALASAEEQGRRFDAAYAHGDKVAPHLHRAGPDVRHLIAVYDAIRNADSAHDAMRC
jgi:hypothetical protein